MVLILIYIPWPCKKNYLATPPTYLPLYPYVIVKWSLMRFHEVFLHKKQILKLPSMCVATEYPAHDFVNSPWACLIDSVVGL